MKHASVAIAGGLMLIASAAIPTTAPAQSFPAKPVRIVVGNLAGSGMDFASRLIGQPMSRSLGVPVVVENRAGAGGLIAAQAIASTPPDGYTYLLVNAGFTTLPVLHPASRLDIAKDFDTVTLVAEAANILSAHPNVPTRTVRDLIALAKARPKLLTIGTLAPGGFTHLCAVLFQQLAKVELTPIQYKGAPAAVVDLIAGQIDFTFSSIPVVLPFLKNNRLRGLGVTTLTRSSVIPDVPTLDESGLKGYDASLWFGLLAPAGTPRDAAARIQSEVAKALETSQVRGGFAGHGLEPKSSSSADLRRRIDAEAVKWAAVLRAGR